MVNIFKNALEGVKRMKNSRGQYIPQIGSEKMIVISSFTSVDYSSIDFPMVTIYIRRSKREGKFYIGRLFDGVTGKITDIAIFRSSLTECRNDISTVLINAVRFERDPRDAEDIVEVWL